MQILSFSQKVNACSRIIYINLTVSVDYVVLREGSCFVEGFVCNLRIAYMCKFN